MEDYNLIAILTKIKTECDKHKECKECKFHTGIPCNMKEEPLFQLVEEKEIIKDEDGLSVCPTCKKNICGSDNFCKHCGQRLKEGK